MKKLFTLTCVVLLLAFALSSCKSEVPNVPVDTTGEAKQTEAPSTDAANGTSPETEKAEEPKGDPARVDWPDESKYTLFKVFEASEEAPRDAVLNYMRKMATIEWTPAVSWTTVHKDPAESARLNLNLVYEAGKKYYGLPYANTGNSFDGFESLLNNGVFTANSPYYTELVGNHCSSSMDRAFEQIIDINGFGGILPEWVPEHLMYPEGSDIKAPEGWTNDTSLITEHCGKDKLYIGYAGLDKGDILYHTSPAWGHTRMVSGVNLVKSVAGKIIYEKSTVSVIEQTNAWYTAEKNSTWFVDKKYTFSELFTAGWLPVTLKAYHDEDFVIPDAYIAFEGENTPETIKKNILSGTVTSNFSFSYVRATVTDKDGKVVLQDAEYKNINKKKISVRNLYLDVKSLPAGTYTFTLRAGIARGGCDLQSFEFTVE